MRLRFSRGARGLLMVGLMAACAPLASAQDAATQQRARQLYGEAQALFDSGQFAAAEQQFQAAYNTVPNPVVLRAIAAAQERQNHAPQAVQTLQQYLAASPQASDRREVETRIRELSAGPATVLVQTDPPGAQIILDSQVTGQVTPADVQMTAGPHTLEVRLPGYRPGTRTFTAAGGQRVALPIPLTPGPGGEPLAGGPPPGAMGSGGGPPDPSIGVWVTAGLGVATLVAGTVFGFLALSEQSNFDGAVADGNAVSGNEIADRGETFALVADISFGVAGAMAITAIVLYVVEASSAPATAALDDGLEFALAPYATPQGGGVSAELRF